MLQIFPVGYALMNRKTEAAYQSVLKSLFDTLLPTLQPSHVMTDFETALQKTIKIIFPEAAIHGCFFHHCHVSV